MKTIFIDSISRFPTIIDDIGYWYNLLINPSDIKRINLNKLLFEGLIDERIKVLIPSIDLSEDVFLNLKNALREICSLETYSSYCDYFQATKFFCDYLEYLNSIQTEYEFGLDGITVKWLNYNNSSRLQEYASIESNYKKYLTCLLNDKLCDVDRCIFVIKNTSSLLCCLIISNYIKSNISYSNIQTVLYNYSYENFTLNHFIDHLKRRKVFTDNLDIIISDNSFKDEIMAHIVNSNYVGNPGYIDKSYWTNEFLHSYPRYDVSPPLIDLLSPLPVIGLRLIRGGCYWGKCTFCIHNAIHSKNLPPIDYSYQVESAIKRIEWYTKAGIIYFVFEDEALPPAFVKLFCEHIIHSALRIRWTCRCRIEYGFDENLLVLMNKAGCYEILFGLESVNKKVINLMNKYSVFDLEKTRTLFFNLKRLSIGAHINVLIGFPGESIGEAKETIYEMLSIGSLSNKFTYQINIFNLLINSEVFSNPGKYNIRIDMDEGDDDLKIIYNYKDYNIASPQKNELFDLYYMTIKQIFKNLGIFNENISKSAFNAYSLANDSGIVAIFKDWEFICKYL